MATVGHRVDGSQLYRHLQIFVAAFRPQVGCWKVMWKHKMEIMSPQKWGWMITTLGGCLAIEVRGKRDHLGYTTLYYMVISFKDTSWKLYFNHEPPKNASNMISTGSSQVMGFRSGFRMIPDVRIIFITIQFTNNFSWVVCQFARLCSFRHVVT